MTAPLPSLPLLVRLRHGPRPPQTALPTLSPHSRFLHNLNSLSLARETTISIHSKLFILRSTMSNHHLHLPHLYPTLTQPAWTSLRPQLPTDHPRQPSTSYTVIPSPCSLHYLTCVLRMFLSPGTSILSAHTTAPYSHTHNGSLKLPQAHFLYSPVKPPPS